MFAKTARMNWQAILSGLTLLTLGFLVTVLRNIPQVIAKLVEQKTQSILDTNLEKLKSSLQKDNALISSLVQNHFNTSQKALNNRVDAYMLLWHTVTILNDRFPAVIGLVNNIFMQQEQNDADFINRLKQNPNFNDAYQPLISEFKSRKTLAEENKISKEIEKVKPFLNDVGYRCFEIYYLVYSRVIFMSVDNYITDEFYNWRNDAALKDALLHALSENELTEILKLNVNSLKTLFAVLENKILFDFRSALGIKSSDAETIKHVVQLTNLFQDIATKQAKLS